MATRTEVTLHHSDGWMTKRERMGDELYILTNTIRLETSSSVVSP